MTRLQHHACIVIWGGNNENEVAIEWYPYSKEHRDRSWSHDSTLSDASTAGVVDAPAQKVDLSLLHACLHCRASKTAPVSCARRLARDPAAGMKAWPVSTS